MNSFMAGLGDARIRYLPSADRPLSMADNWERTIAATTGAWVTVIGDDDYVDPDIVDQVITAWTTGRDVEGLVDELQHAGVPAAVALVPARMYDEPQLLARGFYTALDHARSGVRRYPGWPMRFEPGPAAHHRSGCPTLGQHNDEILIGELGLGGDDIATLRERNIIGERPLGL
jgi:crotonobetainyl-CoA:carnitine CoA-transferase CaiB-like acyl-CoA transferase